MWFILARTIEDGKKINLKLKTRYPVITFDKLQMYFGMPYVIDLEGCAGTVTITPPTIGDIVRFGEKEFYTTLNIFITNTTAYRLLLWKSNIDWNDITDFQLFCMLYKQIDGEAAKLIFGDLDFSKFELCQKQLTPDAEPTLVLYNEEDNVEITEDVYQHIAQYLRLAFNLNIEEKMTSDPMLKEMYIKKDERALENEAKKREKNPDEESHSGLLPVISACVNHPGFKYSTKQLCDVGICEFYDSVRRLQIYENARACMTGMYSGMVDSSKIPADSYNFMKEI